MRSLLNDLKSLPGVQKAALGASWLLCLLVGWHVGSWFFQHKTQAAAGSLGIEAYIAALFGAFAAGGISIAACTLLLAIGWRVTATKPEAGQRADGELGLWVLGCVAGIGLLVISAIRTFG